MKTLTKVSVVLALAGSLTSVMAATNTQTNGSTNTKHTNTKQTNTKQTNNNKQTLSIKTQITAIEHASIKDRVKLVNAFKEKIQAMSPAVKQQAMQMYAHAISGMNQAQGAMQGGMNQAQGAMQGGMNQAQSAMQGQMNQTQGTMQAQGAMQAQGTMQGQMNNKNFMGH